MATIIGRNAVADIKIAPDGGAAGAEVSYKAQFSFFSVRAVVPQNDVTTFATEVSGAFEPGPTTYITTFAGLLMKGAGAIGLLMPPRQNTSCTWQYDTGVSVGGRFNFDDVLAARPAGVNATIAGTARGTGVIVISEVIA